MSSSTNEWGGKEGGVFEMTTEMGALPLTDIGREFVFLRTLPSTAENGVHHLNLLLLNKFCSIFVFVITYLSCCKTND